ncbi:hypothetical protein [Bacteroides caecigallinarum]|uniref:hypothetical protein n=1 Tax=Bacteroides caecigallinarum TaxID=1411144 RepID=UPI001F19D477|nr:hypothetical protein [Bacteroides caecigallinarum]MCF2551747.1 hypothetical protein [Bacteroides caecigallinarum]
MKTSEILKTLVLLICTSIFISCQKEEEEGRKITGYEEYTITIASEKVHVAPCKLQKGNRYAWFHKKGGQERKQTKHDSNNV